MTEAQLSSMTACVSQRACSYVLSRSELQLQASLTVSWTGATASTWQCCKAFHTDLCHCRGQTPMPSCAALSAAIAVSAICKPQVCTMPGGKRRRRRRPASPGADEPEAGCQGCRARGSVRHRSAPHMATACCARLALVQIMHIACSARLAQRVDSNTERHDTCARMPWPQVWCAPRCKRQRRPGAAARTTLTHRSANVRQHGRACAGGGSPGCSHLPSWWRPPCIS